MRNNSVLKVILSIFILSLFSSMAISSEVSELQRMICNEGEYIDLVVKLGDSLVSKRAAIIDELVTPTESLLNSFKQKEKIHKEIRLEDICEKGLVADDIVQIALYHYNSIGKRDVLDGVPRPEGTNPNLSCSEISGNLAYWKNIVKSKIDMLRGFGINNDSFELPGFKYKYKLYELIRELDSVKPSEQSLSNIEICKLAAKEISQARAQYGEDRNPVRYSPLD